jgi:hypothetical protein
LTTSSQNLAANGGTRQQDQGLHSTSEAHADAAGIPAMQSIGGSHNPDIGPDFGLNAVQTALAQNIRVSSSRTRFRGKGIVNPYSLIGHSASYYTTCCIIFDTCLVHQLFFTSPCRDTFTIMPPTSKLMLVWSLDVYDFRFNVHSGHPAGQCRHGDFERLGLIRRRRC